MPAQQVQISPVKVFISYAEQDTDFLAGENLETTEQHLANAQVIILLLSSDYAANTHLWERHLQKAIEQHEQKKIRVIPIRIRPFNDKGASSYIQLQILPRDGRVIGTASNDEAWETVVGDIGEIVKEL